MGLPKIGTFFNNVPRRKESVSEDIIQRLSQENLQLRRELADANNRIRELEAAAAAAISNESEEQEVSLASPKPSETESTGTRAKMDDRDDDSYAYSEAAEYDADADDFSVEVEASAVEFLMRQQQQREDEEELLDIGEEQSTTASACTIPAGNDKKSNTRRRQVQLRRRARGNGRSRNHVDNNHDARRRYFPEQQRHPSIKKIAEITEQRSLLDIYGMDESISITSDLSSSVSSSMLTEDDINRMTSNSEGNALMSGRMLPLYAMKSLLRISSTDSDVASTVLENDESILLGEI